MSVVLTLSAYIHWVWGGAFLRVCECVAGWVGARLRVRACLFVKEYVRALVLAHVHLFAFAFQQTKHAFNNLGIHSIAVPRPLAWASGIAYVHLQRSGTATLWLSIWAWLLMPVL